MGLSNYPSAAEGVLPVLVMNTVLSVALLKNMFRSLLQVVGATPTTSTSYSPNMDQESHESSRERRVSITHYKSLCNNTTTTVECCVCLSRFQANQEVSELPCKHFFHKGCLDKWFDNKHTTCPLCRSME
ncbi:probable E3 ubiquitin-protein ligase XERICO [Gastrolobium bilobum]|uniref:probable E3 ubiquitin-protein ligase XERICO n=1 Tax=Gastrolobium bilobum TaxID=150636 RepID=UPI002AB15035|nr:probable E3 ubiquitin-protein ligase XERICO [Gastrolobium bilobum]